MGFLSKFIDSTFEDIKKNNRARNERALKSDPELKRLEEKLADAHDNLKDVIARRKAKLGY
jgi:hypothetical protein|tara:strand:+ start:177 stop:359 length:183 start_codon:yes stop_codon:yes gene_type:complete